MNYIDTCTDPKTRAPTNLRRRHILKLICIAALGSVMSICGCDSPKLNPDPKNIAMENKIMESVSVTSEIRQQLPPLDTSIPQELKTATFALG
jgi:hypothetical protein